MRSVRGETPAGPWIYEECRPRALAGLVDLAWYFEGPTAYRRKRVFPNGRLELLVNLGDPYAVDGAPVLVRGGLCGLQRAALVIEQPARQRILGLRLRPAGAYALLPAPQWEISGRFTTLEDAFGRAGTELIQRCHDAAGMQERFAVALGWVAERMARSAGLDRAVGWCATQIEESGGLTSIARLRESVGFSAPRLLAAFRDQIGLTPKLYARTVRFARLLHLLQEGASPLADAALAAGYYDQPHMTTEFRELGGITPSSFLASRHSVGDGTTAAG
jgi:AraC-like DNA-binding protein